MKSNKYKREFSEIASLLVDAYQHYEIWWIYKHDREKYVDIMNKYLLFFSASISAHFIAMLMSISCLIDERNVSIKSLYDKMNEEKLLNESESEYIDEKFLELNDKIKGVKILRSNVFAHISEKLDSDKAFEKAKFKYDHFKDLIFSLGEIFNILRKANGMNPLGFQYNSSKSDTIRLLSDLKKFQSQWGCFKRVRS